MKIKNIGAASQDVIETIEKTTTLPPSGEMTIDPNTVKIKIGDIEIQLT